MSPQLSHGWPFDDCTIHVQARHRKEIDLDELRNECEAFGNILKVYTWTSKKSAMQQAYVLFDSPTAVTRATQSFLHKTSSLWKKGYHMLKMCESTSEMIDTFFKQDGITRNDPLFANIPVNKRAKPWVARKHPSERGEKESTQTSPRIPTGPRYRPYSLSERPDTSTSAQASNPITFPPRKEPPSPESPSKPLTLRRASLGSPTSSKFVPSKSWLNSLRTPPPSVKQVASPPSSVSLPPPPSSPPLSSHGDVDQHQLNLKLKSDIEKLVSDYIDIEHEVLDMKTKNKNLENKREAAEQELVQLRSSLEATEAREQALATQLSYTESERDGAQDACTQALAGIQHLLANQQNVEATNSKLETELRELRKVFGAVEGQLARAEAQLMSQVVPPKQMAEVGVQSESLRADTEASAQNLRLGLAGLIPPELQDASSVDPDDACATPTPAADPDQYPLPAKPDQHDFSGFLDAFNDIDNLVRGVFNSSGSSFVTT
ncbi:hypothetical protein FRC07_014183 [Ceratobasidium sp. 392]|nr:hypothetical protein FRC07_014183 [Ceratobasidium sp. 392]